MSDPEQKPAIDTKKDEPSMWVALQLAWDLGWIIALPVVVLGFSGAYLDRYVGTSPLFLLFGLVLALTLSTIGIVRKVKQIVKKRF